MLVAAGLAYLGWAALRFEWGLAGEATAFDRPVARVTLVLVGGLLLAAADAQRPLLRLIDRLRPVA